MEAFVAEKVRYLKPIETILNYLEDEYGVKVSKRTLQRYMKKKGIAYYRDETPQDVMRAILAEQQSPRKKAGIRRMQLRLRTHHNLLVTRLQVWNVMAVINPDRLQINRRRRLERRVFYSEGSNWVWHMDQHDKLKEYGIRIHGCVDGFSRRILWLRASTTLSAHVVAQHFYNCICQENVVPSRVRVDYGTENTTAAKMQIFLRRGGTDEYSYDKAVEYGSSQHNQPVENMWSRFLEKHEYFWIDHFKHLKTRGYWQYGNVVDRWCLLYVYMPLVQEGLADFQSYHNGHRIRKQRNVLRPHGIPEDIHKFPTRYGGNEMGHVPVLADLRATCRHFDLDDPTPDWLPVIVRQTLDQFVASNGITITTHNAKAVYRRLQNYMNVNL